MNVVHYKRGGKYKFVLTAALVLDCGIVGKNIKTPWIELLPTGTLTMSTGYAWDGATGAIDTENSIAGSCGHDALYQLMRLGLLPRTARLKADSAMRKWLIEDGMLELRANIWFLGVCLFGEFYIKR